MSIRERITVEEKGVAGIYAETTASIYSSLSKEGKDAIIADIMNGTFYPADHPKAYLNQRRFNFDQAKKLFSYMLTGQASDLFEALEVDATDDHKDKRPARY